jgi:hypothetical protein
VAYPWTIRGDGDAVYAFDLAFVNVYKGIDFATFRTDNHYINQVVGTVLKDGIRVGNSTVGWTEDNLFNINAWARANGLPNILEGTKASSVAGKFTFNNLRAFVVTRGAQNEHFLSNFVYSAFVGHTFENNAMAIAFNIAADGSKNVIEVNDTSEGSIKIINAEGCCGDGVVLRFRGGTAKVFNLLGMEWFEPAIVVTGGNRHTRRRLHSNA